VDASIAQRRSGQAAVTAYLGLGASLGDRAQNLRDAVERLKEHGLHIIAASPIYESPHLGLVPEDANRYPPHLNAVVAVQTTLSPEALLAAVQAAESAGGRQRLERWGPRTIDIDILAYDALQCSSDRLVLPHPGIARRAFVARPLLDIAPEFRLPGGARLSEHLEKEPVRSQSITRIGAFPAVAGMGRSNQDVQSPSRQPEHLEKPYQ
jgi:2-amino-4-hydroxy-6-hydroxymethyldihydropteridine diphosphokinase